MGLTRSKQVGLDKTEYEKREYIRFIIGKQNAFETEWERVDYVIMIENNAGRGGVRSPNVYELHWKEPNKKIIQIKAAYHERYIKDVPILKYTPPVVNQYIPTPEALVSGETQN